MNPAILTAAMVCAMSSDPQAQPSKLERGRLPARWTGDKPDCANAPPFLAHEYTATFVMLRQSGCTNYEKPFLYLLFGAKQALLVDTGAPGAEVSSVVDGLLRRHAERQQASVLPLLVVHSHGHGDHVAGDAMLAKRAGTTIVDARPDAIAKFFGIRNWPREVVQYDLGDRLLDLVPIPGHEPASIAIYDRRTGVLLQDTLRRMGKQLVRRPLRDFTVWPLTQ